MSTAKIRCSVMARVVGYYRPVDAWNVGQQSQWDERKLTSFRDIISNTN